MTPTTPCPAWCQTDHDGTDAPELHDGPSWPPVPATGGDTIKGAREAFLDSLDGIVLGAYDLRVVNWLTGCDQPTLAVLAGIIGRARDAGAR